MRWRHFLLLVVSLVFVVAGVLILVMDYSGLHRSSGGTLAGRASSSSAAAPLSEIRHPCRGEAIHQWIRYFASTRKNSRSDAGAGLAKSSRRALGPSATTLSLSLRNSIKSVL